ncbi:hypothetical protein AB1Y20_016485 [Prymnesium parvum]|uniref:RING-CH-type domain-containing protein n=1 Tax=Prymnesium parvum TaxID=97485 RepID=A0AB34IBG8_PRYPA
MSFQLQHLRLASIRRAAAAAAAAAPPRHAPSPAHVDPPAPSPCPVSCRFCFEAGGELIAPCRCAGTQKYVHAACLRRWRAHARLKLHATDDRASTCSVCRAPFSPPLASPLADASGAPLARLLTRGVLLVSTLQRIAPRPDDTLDRRVRLCHFWRAVYLILSAEEDCLTGVNLSHPLRQEKIGEAARVEGEGGEVNLSHPLRREGRGEAARGEGEGGEVNLSHPLRREGRGEAARGEEQERAGEEEEEGRSQAWRHDERALLARFEAMEATRLGVARGRGLGAAGVRVAEFIGGPCGAPPVALHCEVLPAEAARADAPAPLPRGGGLRSGGALGEVLAAAAARAARGARRPPPAVFVFHGCARWSRAQLEAEVLHGAWGVNPHGLSAELLEAPHPHRSLAPETAGTVYLRSL